MTVAVYGRAACVQCIHTKKHLDERGISYEYFDVEGEGNELVREVVHHQADAMGYGAIRPELPLVIVTDHHSKVIDKWFGFKIDKIKGIVK